MSWRAVNTCAEQKLGSATRKQIIMFLDDKASDDGSGIWCSKGTIQRHTELGETTVKRTVHAFLKEGILVETGAWTCKNGFTVVYRIDLAKVEALELTAEPEIETGATVAPVQTGPQTIHIFLDWSGGGRLTADGGHRARAGYIAALRAAYGYEFEPLIELVSAISE